LSYGNVAMLPMYILRFSAWCCGALSSYLSFPLSLCLKRA
jgi:hypothetical protein